MDEKDLNLMVDKSIKDLNKELSKADHPILKLAIIARHEGYGIAMKELGADTTKLGKLIDSEALKIEPELRKFFK
jgi:hypothetical protein